MHIGILQCGHSSGEVAERHGDFDTMFERLLDGHGLTFSRYDIEHMQFPDSVQACDGWLLTGSRHGAYEPHLFIPPLEAFIREAYAAAVPQVGICFGHQIIAQALGGRVEKFGGGWGVGRQVYDFDGVGRLALNAWHQDQVVVKPKGAVVTARNAFCEHAALIYGKRALTIQAHPEFSNAIMTDYIASRRGTGTYPDDRMDVAQAALNDPVDQGALAAQIATFFKDARHG
jgi:GMP synthase-like glutamine amidotransferase